jgi:hypothetical protein
MPGLVYPDGDITVTTRRMPLSSPYYDRTRATECVVCMEA